MKKDNDPRHFPDQDTAESQPADDTAVSASSDAAASIPYTSQAPSFATVQRRSSILTDFLRALLIILSAATLAGFVLVLLPQSTVDTMAQFLQSRHETSQPEKFALLYLGDEITNNELQVRGVIRNISTAPIEQLDAAIRFFSHDGSISETAVVRMNKDIIGPGEIAQFELVYPNYKMEFARYAVEFKLRNGDVVPYKDMCTDRVQTE